VRRHLIILLKLLRLLLVGAIVALLGYSLLPFWVATAWFALLPLLWLFAFRHARRYARRKFAVGNVVT
jgi:positive regulator of sigma E activity